MFIPGCDRCGQCGCVCGHLPYTLTVEFSGLVNRTHSTYCALSITSNFGCGAAAVATSPGGCDDNEPECGESDRGPLAGVLLLDGGHDYARIGRREPVITLAGSPGSGATFTATLEPVDPELEEQCRSYQVASVTVDGGTGYTDGDTLRVYTDGHVITPAVLTLANERSAPTITATASGGTGAVLAVSLTSSGSPPVWAVSGVSVTQAGSGYTDGAEVVFTVAAGDVVTTAALATINVGGGEPDDCVAVSPFSVTGTGAAFSWTWTPVTGGYEIVPVIDNGGTGYTVGDFFYFEDTCNDDGPAIYVDSVDGNGAITAVSGGDAYVWPPSAGTGGISSVTVTAAGEAYHDTGVPESVAVDEPGEYYTEDPTAPVCLAEVTVSAADCGGSGAEITATIGDDPEDAETFGTITSLTIDDGGDNYLAWRWVCTNQSGMNDTPFVLTAVEPQKLVTLEVTSDFGSGACLRVVPAGDGTVCDPATPVLYDGQPGPILEVEVVSSGSGYARVVDGETEVATVTVTITQLPPSDGSGAAISVTIGTTPGPDFGKVLSATVTNGGSGYTILGGPTECLYRGDACANDYEPRIEYRLRGNGRQPEVVLIDNRTDLGSTTVLRCADSLADCDSLPASATLLHGAPAGVTATIAHGGTVTTECDQPEFCFAECICPADYILPETQVVVTSDVPCAEGGTASYSGEYQNLDLACGYRNEAAGEIVYTNDIGLSFECCPAPNCNEAGPCELMVRVCASGYVYDDVTDTWCPASGCSECLDWDVVDGEAVGTATFDIVQQCPGNRTTTYSMTVSVGGA